MKTLPRNTFLSALAALFLTASIHAASIQMGDLSANAEGSMFIDEAAIGGNDFTTHDDSGIDADGHVSVGIRPFAYSVGQSGTITITGFGFATSAAAAANDATSINLEFYYLGADGVPDDAEDPDPDDLLLGTVENISYAHSEAGTYYVNFGEESISGQIDGANNQFRIWIKVNDVDTGLQESIRFKTTPGVGSKLSVAGTFEAGVSDPTWAGYIISEDGIVDTGDFMGFLYVGDGSSLNGWVYAYTIESYVYLPEDNVDRLAGAWSWFPK